MIRTLFDIEQKIISNTNECDSLLSGAKRFAAD